MPDDLHARLVAALQARLEVARAATPGPWSSRFRRRRSGDDDWVIENDTETIGLIFSEQNAVHIAANDPATEIRRVEALLRVVERHRPEYDGTTGRTTCEWCAGSYSLWPCHELRDLAAGEGIEVAE